MKLVVTIYEETLEDALRVIRSLDSDHDVIEVRAEKFGVTPDFVALRAATSKPIILTYRGAIPESRGLAAALQVGIDFIDVEWRADLQLELPRERVVLSHHDYKGMRDLESIAERMLAFGCAHTKIAVTPRTLDENLRLLVIPSVVEGSGRVVGAPPAPPGPSTTLATTVIGMGERGLFSRILAPFVGSELTFVAATKSAAPAQLTLDRALAIYGSDRENLHATNVFAIAGNPVGHSLSPSIHNPLFREHGVDAAYTVASFETFHEIAEAFTRGDLRGLSITAPFKEEALAFARSIHAEIRDNARDAGATNTLVRMGDGTVVADNTDVDGFAALIGNPKRVALVGAGGTARAALVALERIGADVRVFNRSPRDFPRTIEPLEHLASFDGDLVISTLPIPVVTNIKLIEASYTRGAQSGLDLLRAQAIRQNQLFLEALR
jgi:3-dehydroquinate dehydratase/shikimate dehydrogenase